MELKNDEIRAQNIRGGPRLLKEIVIGEHGGRINKKLSNGKGVFQAYLWKGIFKTSNLIKKNVPRCFLRKLGLFQDLTHNFIKKKKKRI